MNYFLRRGSYRLGFNDQGHLAVEKDSKRHQVSLDTLWEILERVSGESAGGPLEIQTMRFENEQDT